MPAPAFEPFGLPAIRRGLIGAALGFLIACATPASAAAPLPLPSQPAGSLTVRAEQALRFGTMVVMDSGARTVHASGDVSDESVLSMGLSGTGPALFALAYDRGVEESKPISVVVQITLLNTPSTSQGGLISSLSAYETDLPGVGPLQAGRPVTATISGCTTRVCALSFHVGARLAITRNSGGGSLTINPPIIATLLAVEG